MYRAGHFWLDNQKKIGPSLTVAPSVFDLPLRPLLAAATEHRSPIRADASF